MPGQLLLAVVLGLAPVGALGTDADLAADTPLGPAGAAVGFGADGAHATVTAPVAGTTRVAACDGCPLLATDLLPEPAAEDAQAAGATDASSRDRSALGDLSATEAAAATSLSAAVLAALAWLAQRLAVGLPLFGFSRIDDDKLARHPARQLALQFIAANPGANIQDVRRALGLAWGTTVYHLGRLEKGGLVAVRHVGGERRHWPLGAAPSRDALPATGRALAALVQERPGLAQAELAAALGVGAPAACKQLARLESAGLVVARRDGRTRRYDATPRLASALAAA